MTVLCAAGRGPVAAPFRFRIPRRQQHELGREGSHERVDSVRVTASSPDAGLVVPDQPTRNPAELLDQLPGPEQQILRLPRRDHHSRREPAMRRGDHQHRQQLRCPVLERDLLRREPQIALRRVPRRPRDPIRGIETLLLGPQPLHVVTEPPDRARPPDPLREHRRRHRRRLQQQRTHPRLERRERRRRRCPLIVRRRFRVHRLDDRGPRDPQPLSNMRLRHALAGQPPDQRPVLQSDHSPIVECSLFKRRYCPVFERRRQRPS